MGRLDRRGNEKTCGDKEKVILTAADRQSLPIVLLLFASALSSSEYETTIRSLADAYSRAENWSTKRQILSIVAVDLPTHLLKREFVGVTDWKIKVARAHASFQGKHIKADGLTHLLQAGVRLCK